MFGDAYVSFQKQILFTITSTLFKNEQKLNVGSFKIPVHGRSCHVEAARHVKL